MSLKQGRGGRRKRKARAMEPVRRRHRLAREVFFPSLMAVMARRMSDSAIAGLDAQMRALFAGPPVMGDSDRAALSRIAQIGREQAAKTPPIEWRVRMFSYGASHTLCTTA